MQLGIKNSVGRTMCARHFAIDPIIAYKAKVEHCIVAENGFKPVG